MRATTCLVTLWFGGVVLCGGCQGERTTPVTSPAVNPPRATGPAQDVPPVTPPGNPTTVNSVNRGNKPALPDAEKSSLIYQAKLDLLRILICCDEGVVVEGRPHPSSAMQQVVAEHFSNMGFRVLDGSPCPEYTAPPEELALLANERDVDLFVLLRGVSTPVDKFGEFYSFEVDGRSKVVQISGNELLTTQSALVRGKRALNEGQAAESALKMCGEELAKKLSDEIVRKSSRGALVRTGSRRGLAQSHVCRLDSCRSGTQAGHPVGGARAAGPSGPARRSSGSGWTLAPRRTWAPIWSSSIRFSFTCSASTRRAPPRRGDRNSNAGDNHMVTVQVRRTMGAILAVLWVAATSGRAASAPATLERALDETINQVAQEAAQKLKATSFPDITNIAVLPLWGDCRPETKAYIVNTIQSQVIGGRYRVIERDRQTLDTLLKEIAWDTRREDVMDAATVQQFGKIAGCDAIVFGTVRECAFYPDSGQAITRLTLTMHSRPDRRGPVEQRRNQRAHASATGRRRFRPGISIPHCSGPSRNWPSRRWPV